MAITNYNNLSNLQNFWRDDENVLRSFGQKSFLSALPRLYNEQAKTTYKNKMLLKFSKVNPEDFKVSEESNGFSHLYLHYQDGLRDEQVFIRYTREATYLKNYDVLFYVDERNIDKYRKAVWLCFVEKNGTDRYLIDSKAIDYLLNKENGTFLLSDVKQNNLFIAHWHECGDDTFELDKSDKSVTRIYRATKKENKDNTLSKFDITQSAGHRDTSRAIKVYSVNTNFLTTVKNIKSLYKTAVDQANITKTERQFINAASSAASTSVEKIKNFKENNKLPRTKTSFLKLGLYIFDDSISDEDIKNYMAALQSAIL